MFADFDIDEIVTCPTCHTEQAWEEALLGVLGDFPSFRCRGCGWVWTDTGEE